MISEIMKKMIDFSEKNLHDIDHFMKVYAYAKTIGELESLDEETQLILEAAAITHDIACPLCREKYGNTNGKYQEKEGAPLVREFLADARLSSGQIDRISDLVGHHHTFDQVDGLDYQILIEADYIVNAAESHYTAENIRAFKDRVFRTKNGTAILEMVFSL